MKNLRLASAAAALSLGAGALTGCSAIDGALHKYSTTSYDDAGAVEEAGIGAAWIPGDAGGIVVRTSTVPDAPDAVVVVRSSSQLADDCTEVDRQSAPSWFLDGMPDVYAMKKVFACGGWSVVATDDGWAGWTPNSAVEREDAAADG
jgi:hypothetical protein